MSQDSRTVQTVAVAVMSAGLLAGIATAKVILGPHDWAFGPLIAFPLMAVSLPIARATSRGWRNAIGNGQVPLYVLVVVVVVGYAASLHFVAATSWPISVALAVAAALIIRAAIWRAR